MKYELPSIELIVIEENNYLKFGEYLNDMQCDDTANKLSLDDLEYVKKLQQENKILRENAEHNDKVVDKVNWENMLLKKENKQLQEELECTIGIVEHNRIISEKNNEIHQLKDKLSKIETLIINHNCDTGDIYYKYDSRFLKSELKQRILEIVYEQGSDK